MVDLYVYYKVPDQHAPGLEPLVRTMQASLARRHGVAVQLKRRPESKDGLQTWMEVYPAVGGDFAPALEIAAREAGLAQFVDGPRRTEVFTDLTPCA